MAAVIMGMVDTKAVIVITVRTNLQSEKILINFNLKPNHSFL